MDRTDLSAGQHRDRQFRDATHVDRDPVALLHAQCLQHARELAHFAIEGVVGERALVAAFAFPNEGQLVAAMGLELSLIHISEPTRLGMISYAVFCLKKKK